MKNLENYGVQELNTREIKEVNGGWRIIRVIAAALAAYHDQVCDGEGRCEMSLTKEQSEDYYRYRGM